MGKKLLFFVFLIYSVTVKLYAQQNVSISDVNTSPDASSVLDVSSTTKGLLVPRVALTSTTNQSPIPNGITVATALLVYNTATSGDVTPGFYHWANNKWNRFDTGNNIGDWKLLGNSGTNASSNFLGTTDNVDLVFRTNNTEKVRVLSGGNVGIGTTLPSNKLSILTPTSNDGIFLTDGTRWMRNLPGTTGNGSYNNIVSANDNALIFSGGSLGTGNLVIAPWASATSGIKILGSNGNVGIGLTNPLKSLHIGGTTSSNTGVGTPSPTIFNPTLRIDGLNSTSTSLASNTYPKNLVVDANGDITIGDAAKIFSTSLTNNASYTSTIFANFLTLNFNSNSTEAFVVFSASGYGYTNSRTLVYFKILVNGVEIFGTGAKVGEVSTSGWSSTNWNATATRKVPVNIGSNTIVVQYRCEALTGTAGIAIDAAGSGGFYDHATITVIQ
jgi:hypothetical protein